MSASRRRTILIVGAIVAVLLAIVIVVRVNAARAEDRRVDEFYCTLSGVGPFDRAPRSGERCMDLD